MDALLFADQLRIMRRSPKRDRSAAGINLAGAGGMLLAACAACLVMITLLPTPPHAPRGAPVADKAAHLSQEQE